MRKILLAVMSLSVALCGIAREKKAVPAPDLFPDGTPIDEWFRDENVLSPEEIGPVYDLADYGLFSDPRTTVTEKIQAVIDKAASEGGGVIVVPEGIYKTGALFFKQGTHLHLKQGAIILGSENIADFPVVMTRIEGQWCPYFAALINIDQVDGFSLTGKGIIDGNGATYWQGFRLRKQWNRDATNKDEQRPRLVFFNQCRNVTISEVTFQNSPFWTTHYYKCDHVRILNARIFSPIKPIASPSADGIDMDACTNFHIKGCRITVNDDAVCLKGGKGPDADTDPSNGANMNILVENVFFDHTTSCCLTLGSESIHARNILMRNCTVSGSHALLRLKMRSDTPQMYEYITVENMSGYSTNLLVIGPYRQFFDLQGHTEIPRSHGSNIIMRNIQLESQNFMDVRGVPDEYDVNDFLFENVSVTTKNPNWDRSAFDSYTMKNVTVNGQEVR